MRDDRSRVLESSPGREKKGALCHERRSFRTDDRMGTSIGYSCARRPAARTIGLPRFAAALHASHRPSINLPPVVEGHAPVVTKHNILDRSDDDVDYQKFALYCDTAWCIERRAL